MAAPEPFPKFLRRALLWPFAVFAAAYVLALLGKGSQDNVTSGLWLIATAGAALVELIAVPAAVVLLVREAPRYSSLGNLLLTLAAALPLLFILFVVLLFSGALGTVHF